MANLKRIIEVPLMRLTASETGAERFDKVDRARKPETEDQENAGISDKLVYKGYGVR